MAEFLTVFATLGALVTKSVDFVRNLVDKGDTFPKETWNVVAFAVGVAYCLGWQVDYSSTVIGLVPALAEHADRLQGVAGQVFTGLIAGGFAGFLHELFDALSSVAKRTT